MNPVSNRSITLLELLIAISIIGLLVIGLLNIDTFSRYQVMSSDRRVKLQNDASYTLEHMAKEIARAIGNEKIDGVNKVVDIWEVTDSERTRIKVYIDASGNGIREPEINNPLDNQDHWISYRFYDSGGSANQIQYCSRCRNKNCNNCATGWTTLSNRMTNFDSVKPTIAPLDNTLKDNYVEIQLTNRWDPTQAVSTDNPEINMKNRISMPAVSTY